MVKHKYIAPCILLGLLLGSLMAACGGTSQAGTSSSVPQAATATHAAAAPHGKAGAQITAPFTATITGGTCGVQGGENKGVANFVFGHDNLTFTLGPDPTGLDDSAANNKAFHGPDTYPNITITAMNPADSTQSAFDLGTVTVNADGQTGSFAIPDKGYAGTFDCGAVLLHG